jgi:hypothetical protein
MCRNEGEAVQLFEAQKEEKQADDPNQPVLGGAGSGFHLMAFELLKNLLDYLSEMLALRYVDALFIGVDQHPLCRLE